MKNTPTHISNTPAIHTHAVSPLELQAVGGAMRLGWKKDGLDAMRQQVLQNMIMQRALYPHESGS